MRDNQDFPRRLGVAPGLDGRPLCQPGVVLPLRDSVALRLANQSLQCAEVQSAVRRVRDRLPSHRLKNPSTASSNRSRAPRPTAQHRRADYRNAKVGKFTPALPGKVWEALTFRAD